MADEIISKYSNLKITAEDDDVVVIDDIPHETSVLDLQLSIIGRVMTVRTFNFEAFKKNNESNMGDFQTCVVSANRTWSLCCPICLDSG